MRYTRARAHARARRSAPDMEESRIERWITERVKELGGRSYKWVSPGSDGVPDRIYLLPGGRIVFAELKAREGRLSKIQEKQIGLIRKLGFRCEVIRGKEGARKFVEGLKNEIHPA